MIDGIMTNKVMGNKCINKYAGEFQDTPIVSTTETVCGSIYQTQSRLNEILSILGDIETKMGLFEGSISKEPVPPENIPSMINELRNKAELIGYRLALINTAL